MQAARQAWLSGSTDQPPEVVRLPELKEKLAEQLERTAGRDKEYGGSREVTEKAGKEIQVAVD